MNWFTSDTHFSHKNVIKYCRRPFASLEAMNEELVRRWNAVVQPNDFVYHLGDVAMGVIVDTLPIVSRLNGIKHLLPGNHDRISSIYPPNSHEKYLPLYQSYFTLLPETMSFCLFNGRWVKLAHFPYRSSDGESRHLDSRPVDDGESLLVHGHVHERWKTNGRMFNVGVDVHNFQPVPENELVAWSETLPE